MIRVIVAEDHHLVRQGIVKLLEGAGDISVVGEADNGAQAVELVDVLQPDVMVLDLTMPHVDGLEALRQIVVKRPRPQIVILSMHADPNIVRQSLRAGAIGYVIKQSVAEELLAAVRAARNGSLFLSSGVIAQDFFTERPQNLLDRLSPREREVVKRLVEGQSARDIAEALRTSIKTVEKQRRDAMRKLDVDNLASLVRVSLELGLVVGAPTRSRAGASGPAEGLS
ncbi:MAG TPA: response regulator transcription factor [Anaerolineales bacterium]|nr:response regulator transcription factor [Anaerolineales bacterium]HRF48301.1 response regulator transcription factor [Anaerolineales bacterium]